MHLYESSIIRNAMVAEAWNPIHWWCWIFFQRWGAFNMRRTIMGYNLLIRNTSGPFGLSHSDFQKKLFRLQHLIVIYLILRIWESSFAVHEGCCASENTAKHFTSRLFYLKHKPKMVSQCLFSNDDRKPVVRLVIFCLRQCKHLSVKCSKGTFSQPDSTGSQALTGARPTPHHLIMSIQFMWLGKKFKQLFQWTFGSELLLYK